MYQVNHRIKKSKVIYFGLRLMQIVSWLGNKGGDDWDIAFKITPDTIQKPIGTAVIGYQFYIQHWVAGVKTGIDGGFKTTDYTYNVVGNGAGVYLITQIYVLDDSSFFF